MEQNSVMVENMEGKPSDGHNKQQAETNFSTTNVQRFLTSVNELAIKNFEMLQMGTETRNDNVMDQSLEYSFRATFALR